MRGSGLFLIGAILSIPAAVGAEETVGPQVVEDAMESVRFDPVTRTQTMEARAPLLDYSRSPSNRSAFTTIRSVAQDLICCPPDDRIEVGNPTVFPFSTVCKVFSQYANGNTYVGTATMVGPRHAVTAGHVVYSASDGGWPTSIVAIPAFSGSPEPFGEYNASSYYTLSRWISSEDPEYDFGLLEFNTNVGDLTGWLGYKWTPFFTDLLGTTLNTAGYPGDLQSGGVMYYASGPCVGVSDRQLAYNGTMDTAGGQSGSGVWVIENGDREIVAVHAYGSPSFNSGTRITEAVFNLIEAKKAGTSTPPTSFVGEYPFLFRKWNKVYTFYGQYVSYEFDVNETILGGRYVSTLRFKVAPKGSYATVFRPDGSSFIVYSGSWVKVYAPQYGAWRMLVYNQPRNSAGNVKVRVKPSVK